MLTTIILFLLILGLLVFVHELGHFWVAKKNGVTVHEFAFGFKPRLFAWKRGETEYAINLIPLGGYVRMEGETEETGKKGSFVSKPPLVRAAVLVAGVVMNLILAWVLLTASYIIGSPSLSPTYGDHLGVINDANIVVVAVTPDSPASKAGLAEGDIILKVNDEPIKTAMEMIETTKELAGQEITLHIERDSNPLEVKLTPRQNPPEGQGAIGIGTGESSLVRAKWYNAPWVAILEVGSEIKLTAQGLGQFVAQLFTEQKVSEDVSGIVGIGAATGVVRQLGIGPVLQFIALISTNLAFINIMPLLPLDGGHLLVVAVEAIKGKKVRDSFKQGFALTGLALILLLVVVVTYKDFLRFDVIDKVRQLF